MERERGREGERVRKEEVTKEMSSISIVNNDDYYHENASEDTRQETESRDDRTA